MIPELSLTVNESPDSEDGVIRLDQADMRLLGAQPGDVLALAGTRTTYARALPAYMEDRNQRLARVSPLLRANFGVQPEQKVRVLAERHKPALAEKVTLQVDDDLDGLYVMARLRQLSAFWHDRPIIAQDLLRVPTLDWYPLLVRVVSSEPAGLVQIASGTAFSLVTKQNEDGLSGLGGLRDVYRMCQSAALARFKPNGAGAAGAVLLTGPAGCGKSRMVARLAQELKLPIVTLDAHQLVDKQLESPTGDLALSLTDLARRGPTILLLEHLEALTAREGHSLALDVSRCAVLAQLCALLDELPTQPSILLFGSASDSLDPRLGAQGRFDLVIPVDAPNRPARHEILIQATRGLPLAEDVDLGNLAILTSGAVAGDLKRLVTAASVLASDAIVTAKDFDAAFHSFLPSALHKVRCEIPADSWDEVAGLDDTKQMLRETLAFSLRHHDKFMASGVLPPRALLLSGGQGSGKTTLARALAGIMPLNFIEIDCPVLTALEPDAAVTFIHDSFALARRKGPCLVFFDDIDAFFEPGPSMDMSPRLNPVVAQILMEIDGITLIPGIVVIATAKRPDRITAEVMRPGRFDNTVVLPLPDTAARKKILQVHARRLPLASDVDLDRLARVTQNMTPADIANLCNRVGLMAFRQSQGNEGSGVIPPVVNAELFEQVLRGRKG
jgi:transitional endoplasmic reticulum ATPase